MKYISQFRTPVIALSLLAINTGPVWAAGAGLPWEASSTTVYNSFKGPVAWAVGGGGLVVGLVAHHYSAQLEQVFHSFTAKAVGVAGGLGVVGLMATLFGAQGALV
jgi:type IV secretory pathway VirB2 component (pilin)